MTTIREALEPVVLETIRMARRMIDRSPRETRTVLGLGDCALSHGMKLVQDTGGGWVLKASWPRERGGAKKWASARSVSLSGTEDENRGRVDEAMGAMAANAAQGTEDEFRVVLRNLLDAGVSAEVLQRELDDAIVRSVMGS